MDPNQPFVPNYGEQKPTFRSHIIEFFQTIVVFAAILAGVYYFLAQPNKVSGLSMFPNFHNGDYIITNKLIYRFQKPQRGQVIILKNPRDTSQDFIKRIIGLPEEKVRVENGHVYINDKLLSEPYIDSSKITEGRTYMHDGEDIQLNQNQYIVMGDNRPDSSDSREWGPITGDEIVGEAFFRYWPTDSVGLIPQAKYPN